MNNPMAQTEPVEQRFGVPASNETAQSPDATRQIDGTDVIEQGTLAAENVLEALKDVIDPSSASTSSISASSTVSSSVPRTRCASI